MKIFSSLLPAFALALVVLPPAHQSRAEIYKWVDEKGNVHFGDKPRDERDAAIADKVDVREDYRPVENLTDEEKALQLREQQARKRLSGWRQQQETKIADPDEEQAAQRKQARDEACASLFADYQRLAGLHMNNGRLTRTYITDDEGKSITATEQEAIAERMRKNGVKAGCPQFARN